MVFYCSLDSSAFAEHVKLECINTTLLKSFFKIVDYSRYLKKWWMQHL